jgi:hypothetical protein
MNSLNLDEVCVYVNEHIDTFHKRRIEIISNLTLNRLIDKNPYLFRAKNVTQASELIGSTLEAFLSSSEEKLFGDFLEDLAIFIASKTTSGHKSTAPGMDLEFENNGIYHIVSIKSGINWGNSSQHAKLATDFANAERRLRQSTHIKTVQKVLGICYGKTKTSSTNAGYIKIVGQSFWAFISDNKNLYIDIIEPVGYRAREHNDAYQLERGRITNLLTKSFIDQFCNPDGRINWPKLIKANSGNYDLDSFFGS